MDLIVIRLSLIRSQSPQLVIPVFLENIVCSNHSTLPFAPLQLLCDYDHCTLSNKVVGVGSPVLRSKTGILPALKAQSKSFAVSENIVIA